jgi:hypothetical protein
VHQCIPIAQYAAIPELLGKAVKRYHYETHDQLKGHPAQFLTAYNFAKRLKMLRNRLKMIYHFLVNRLSMSRVITMQMIASLVAVSRS